MRLDRSPVAARIVAGGLDQVLAGWLGERERSAFERGVAQGREVALASAAGALDGAAARLDAELDRASAVAVEVALEIARVLLRREVQLGNFDLEQIVRETLALSGVGRGRCVVHVNPADAAMLAGVSFRAGTSVESDPTVPRGGVQVSTPQGLLVRELEQALAQIAEQLREEA
jgi:flagellar biosynthesis/type III secretory pathway protein FliH